jgi:hypothetical protein
MTDHPLVQQVLDRCKEALFTGTIRVHNRQAAGELWLLSGILERVRFGVSLDNEAMKRLLNADSLKVELIPCLPNPGGGFKKGHPVEGELGAVRPVDLLQFCERYALTCTLKLQSGDVHGEVVYRLGELVSVHCDTETDGAVAQMLEWSSGLYRFVLPSVAVPAVPTPSVAPANEEVLPDSSAWRVASNEALKRKAEEADAKSQAEAQPRSVVVRVRRVTVEYAEVAVPLSPSLMGVNPGADGAPRIDTDALFAEAVHLAQAPTLAWRPEGEPVVEVDPTQQHAGTS